MIETHHDDGQTIHTLRDKRGEMAGVVVIDSTVNGRARGGLRLAADLSVDEIRAAARAMTHKYGLLGLPQGGAKAGVAGDADAPIEQRRERLALFARLAEPLLRRRLYVPDSDMGTRSDDIRWMMRSIGFPVKSREWRGGRSGHYTAVSTMAAAEAISERRGIDLRGATVAIEGFGSVGSALAELMVRRGARVVAISTSRGALYNPGGLDVPRLVAAAREVGSAVIEQRGHGEPLPREQLLLLPVDLLCPCARFHSITLANAAAVQARAICPGANNALAPDAEAALAARGVAIAPDFLSNCGGVLGGTMDFAAQAPDVIESVIRQFVHVRLHEVMNEAERCGIAVREVAEQAAMERFEQTKAAAEQPGARGRLFSLALACYRRGWLPAAAVSRLARPYFQRRFGTSSYSPIGAADRFG